jgi:exopolysaccharide production protein ExoZ
VLKNIQFMRAVAAYAVVCHHIIFTLNDYVFPSEHIARRIIFNAGAFGVDLFFAISGFVMAEIISKPDVRPLAFAGHRIARIIPTYWLLTCVASVAIFFGLSLFGSPPIDVESVSRSLFFIPQFQDSGEVRPPILFVGWSLNYEMFFYALLTCVLFVPNAALWWPLVWAVLLVFMVAANFTENAVVKYYGSVRVFEFAVGALVWRIVRYIRLPRSVAFAVIGIAVLILLAVPVTDQDAVETIQMWSALSAVLLMSALSLEFSGVTAGWDWAQFQGDASYSVYLIHPFVLQIVAKAAVESGLTHGFLGQSVTVLVMLGAVACVASGFYVGVEKPLARWARRFVNRAIGRQRHETEFKSP